MTVPEVAITARQERIGIDGLFAGGIQHCRGFLHRFRDGRFLSYGVFYRFHDRGIGFPAAVFRCRIRYRDGIFNRVQDDGVIGPYRYRRLFLIAVFHGKENHKGHQGQEEYQYRPQQRTPALFPVLSGLFPVRHTALRLCFKGP